jgi:uncharacterized protein YjdB
MHPNFKLHQLFEKKIMMEKSGFDNLVFSLIKVGTLIYTLGLIVFLGSNLQANTPSNVKTKEKKHSLSIFSTPPIDVYQTPGTHTFVVPDGVTSIMVETWGAGGRGGSRTSGSNGYGGGGGGAYSRQTIAVTPGQTLTLNVGAGATTNTVPGGDSWVSTTTNVSNAFVLAKGGNTVANNGTAGAAGGSAASGIGSLKFSGGNGATRTSATISGGGGSSAAPTTNGNNASGMTGGAAPLNGGAGGDGRNNNGNGFAGEYPGGGGGGAVRTSLSPTGGNGANGKIILNYDIVIAANAGPDQIQCKNAAFNVSGNFVNGYTGSWSIVSGTPTYYGSLNTNNLTVVVAAGTSATMRYSLTDGASTYTDDVVLTNNNSCSPVCTNALNHNGDLEDEGIATNFNLNFQSTPALLIQGQINPPGWSERYGGNIVNTSTFQGAYYLKKTGVASNPFSGSHMIYMKGSGFCASVLQSETGLACGKTYNFSVMVAAYSNGSTQGNAPFKLEFFSSTGGSTPIEIYPAISLVAPASTSWNNLNWQRYEFVIELPNNGFSWADFYFTTESDTHGIAIDDICIKEVSTGSTANAGPDQSNCGTTFVMAANTPPSGYSGEWSVVNGSATIANPTSPTSNVTVASGSLTQLRWTVSGGGSAFSQLLNPYQHGGFEIGSTLASNGWIEVNHGTNNWNVWGTPGVMSGYNAAFISNAGTSAYTYNNSVSQTSHFYRDITVPTGQTDINLSFKWKNIGESGYDRLLVYTAPTSVTPVAGVPSSNGSTISGATLVSSLDLHTSSNYQTANIVLPAALAGTTFRLIFTWQNDGSAGSNPPIAIDEISLTSSGSGPNCISSDDVILSSSTGGSITVNSPTICAGASANLIVSGCSGDILWSNGATTSSITVSPLSTSTYSVTCTPPPTSNLILNPGFENITDLIPWENWGNASITTEVANVRTGNKALKLDASSDWAGVGQNRTISPGENYTAGFWAKTNNTNPNPRVGMRFFDASWNPLGPWMEKQLTSVNYTYYEVSGIAPPLAQYLQLTGSVDALATMYIDDITLTKSASCNAVATSTVTVGASNNITLSNVTVGSCINHPLEDVVPVTVQVSWTSAPAGDYLRVKFNNKNEIINIPSGLTSPQIVTFYAPAKGTNNHVITADWLNTPSCESSSASFNLPGPCSSDQLNCDILYLCGNDKPYDGMAFDHGIIEYIMANNAGAVMPVLTKDDAQGFYDPMTNTPITIDINNYKIIIVSATTEGWLSQNVINQLKGFSGNILNMNYLIQQDLGLTTTETYSYQTSAYYNNTQQFEIYNYDNPGSYYTPVITGGNYISQGVGSLWFAANSVSGRVNGMQYNIKAHSIPNFSSTHGNRIYLGLHMNGLWASPRTGYVYPPVSADFHPAKHLSMQAKVIFDQALKDITNCTDEICENGIDDDGDGLVDCFDPDCGLVLNREFDEGLTNWNLYQQSGATANAVIDNTSQLSGLNSARINITAISGSDWHIQATQNNVSLVAGKTYNLSFSAKASTNRQIVAAIDLGQSPWTSYFYQILNITTSAQNFTYSFTASATTPLARVVFNLGLATGTVWLDNVQLIEVCIPKEICDNGIDDDGDGLIDGNDYDCNMCPTGSLNLHRWTGISGTAVANLTSNANYPNSPTVRTQISNFDGPDGVGDNYGSRVLGFITPSVTGSYLFNLTGDDDCQLFLSTDSNPNNKTLISSITGWTNQSEYNKYVSQTSTSINLVAGNNYYIELLQKEGSGGDHFQVYWQTPSNSSWTIIPGANLRPFICTEICDNGIDDDGNGFTDGADAYCNCDNTTNGGIISGDEISCLNFNPGIILSVSAASGGSGSITYQWEYSTDNINWYNVSGATGLTYDPGQIFQTTYYRRKSKISTCGIWGAVSNVITKQNTGFDNFQILSLGNVTFTNGTHVHGPMATGGDLIINSAGSKVEVNMDNVGTYIFPGDGNVSTGLLVRGGVTFTSGFMGILSNRYVHIGNSTNILSSDNGNNSSTRVFPFGTNYDHNLRIETTVDQTPTPAVFQPVGYDFESIFNYYNGHSLSMGSRTNNVQLFTSANVAIPNNNVSSSQQVKINTLNNGYNYLNISTTSLNNFSQLSFETNGQPSASKILVINVPITSNFTWNNTNVVGINAAQHAPYIIWNFYGSNTNTVTINNGTLIFGTIFMPNQNLVKAGGNDIEGSLIAKTVTIGNGQLHDFMFADFCGLFDCTNKVTATISGNSTPCAGSNTVLTASGGNTYLWSNGSTTASITVNPNVTTTYSVTVTDFAGCTGTATTTLNVIANPTPSISGTNTICAGGSTTFTATGGGTYLWSAGAATTAAISVNTAGTYTVTVTNAAGCTATATRVLTINANPTPSISGTNTICSGGSTTFTANGGGTYLWSAGAATTAAISVNTAGTYTVTVTNAAGCTATATRVLTVNANPTPSISGTNTICAGGSSTFTATGGGTYLWSAGAATTAAISVNTAGTYTVTVTNAAGCTATATRVLTVNANPTPSISGTNTICAGGSTTFTATGGGTYLWSAGAATTAAISVNTAGTYTVTVTNAAGCTATATRILTVNANPTPSISGTNTICAGGSTSFTATGGGTYLWSAGAATTATISVNTAGTYTVAVTNAAGCTATATRVLTVNANPTPSISGTNTICAGGSTTFTATGGGTYLWSAGAATTAAISVNTAGTYTVTVTNAAGCSATATRVLTVNANPTPTITGTNTICAGNSSTFTASGGVTYLWSEGAATTAAILVSSAGTYTVTVTNAAGCTATATRVLTVNANPTPSITGTNSICTGNSTTFTATGGGTYLWSAGSATTAAISVNAAGTYTVTVTNAAGCTATTTRVLTINANPTPSITGTNTICAGSSTIFTASGGDTYLWSSGGATTAAITVSTAGTYTVTVTNVAGCTSTSTRTLNVNALPAIISTTPGERCGSGTVILEAVASAGTLNWFTTPTGGTSIGSGSPFTTPSISSTTTYYVEALNNGCTSSSRSSVVATIKPIPGTKIISSASRCGPGSVTLAVLFGSGNSNWYDAPTGGTLLASGNSFTTPILNTTTTYYIEGELNGCVSASRQAITATIHPVPVANIVGTNTICEGQCTIFTASGGVTYLWSTGETTNEITVDISNTYTVTVTNTEGCTATSSRILTLIDRPVVNISGSASICLGSTTTLSPSSGGTWISSNPTIASVTNAGVVTGLAAGTATFTFTDNITGCASNATSVVTVNPLPESAPCLDFPTSGRAPCFGAAEICDGEDIILKGKGYGVAPLSFMWDNGIGAGANHTITLSSDGLPTKTYTFVLTVTDGNGCTDTEYVTVYVHSKPVVNITGSDKICIGNTTTLSPTTGGTWTSNNPTIATVSNSGVVTGIAAGTASFYFTNSTTNCVSNASGIVTVGPSLSTTIDYNGSVCIENNSQLSAINTGGTAPFTYNWAGPSGFSGNTQTVSITNNGNYYLSVTDSYGCTANISGFVNEKFDPFVVNLNTEVCEGESVTLTASGTSAISYLWSANASNATTQAVSVIPTVPSSTYAVTVTNNLNCTAVINSTINVKAKPIVDISGGSNICIGTTTQLTPSTGGTWSSSNPSIASVSNTGLVTGQSVGLATFRFTASNTNCISDPTAPVTVNPIPVVSITGPVAICRNSTTTLSPNTGGTWISTNPTIASVTNAGIVTGLREGTARFIFTNTATGCVSNQTAIVTVDESRGVTISGDNQYCIGESATLSASRSGGSWSSSNTSIATVSNTGVVTAISAGAASIVYHHTWGACDEDATYGIIVHPRPTVSITGATTICQGLTTTLSPSTGGTWSSSNPAVATVTNTGVVTGVSPGTATFTFTNSSTTCPSNATAPVTILGLPAISYSGSSTLCIGGTTTLSPTTGGTWLSTNPTVASITNQGVVTALSAGNSTFRFTNSSTGCVSNDSGILIVNPKPQPIITGPSEICIGSTTTISPTTGGTWTSENPSIANISNAGLITGVSAGISRFTFTDGNTGCISDLSSSVIVNPLPSASIDYMGSVCLNDNSQLEGIPSGGTPGYTYAWSGPSSFSGNTKIVDINTNGGYNLTITDSKGCSAVTTGFVYQRFDPYIVNVQTQVCDGQSINLNVSAPAGSTYQWSNNAGNSQSQSVTVVPVIPSSLYYVTVTSTIGCTAVTGADIKVNPKPILNLVGADAICIGFTTMLSPTSGGFWSSSSPTTATITNAGVVTGHNAGTASFTFTDSTTGCISDSSVPVTIHPRPVVAVSGPSAICIGNTTTLSPSSGGTWISNNPSVASVTNSGVVTGISSGSAGFIFTNASTGCTSGNPININVNPTPQTLLTGVNEICIGVTTQIMPTSGGTWISNNPTIATITNSGLITGVSAGNTTFRFTDSVTGCHSNATEPITVFPRPAIAIEGNDHICPTATTTLTPNSGGTWISNNPTVATVTNAGIVTGIAPGQATFYFISSSTNCPSQNSLPITVYARPIVGITGPNSICVNNTTTLSPVNGGTWISNNTNIATVNNSGLVTGILGGSTTFRFVQSSTGCTSLNTPSITVFNKPNVAITGSSSICVNGTSSLSPIGGGTWVSNSPSVASVSNSGMVTGLAIGTATFIFTETSTGCSSSINTPITVGDKPVVSILGGTLLCVGTTTSLSPSTGGTWVSTNPSVASVSNAGIVTGLSNGTARFTFITNDGCTSDPTASIIVNGNPTISASPDLTICKGETTSFTSNSSGTWTSSNPNIATINNAGIVTGVAPGFANFVFTDAVTGCITLPTEFVNVMGSPSISILGASSICIGANTQLSPTVGGAWSSLNPGVATINNTGLVSGISAGTVRFVYVQSSSSCPSLDTISITVNPNPVVSIAGSPSICEGSTTNLLPSSGGNWVSLSGAVASVNNAGVVTGLRQGAARFRFTSTSTGCSSTTGSNILINARPSISLNGETTICVGGSTAFLPSAGGAWTSSDETVATINNNGIVTGVGPGLATFSFTDSSSGCTSLASLPIEVTYGAAVSIIGDDLICLGYTTQLSPVSGGYWESSHPEIATVNNSGLVTGKAPGQVSFTFTDAESGCISSFPADVVKIVNCLDPDFNVTFTNLVVNGNVATNDDIPTTGLYGHAQLIAKPMGSIDNLVINTNGTYTFTANIPGVYEYRVPVCIPPSYAGCPFSDLVITVVDKYNNNKVIVANTDFSTTYQVNSNVVGTPVSISALDNDICLNVNYCTLSPSNMSVHQLPSNGQTVIDFNGQVIYTPSIGFAGQEILRYSVCSIQDNLNCAIAKQLITTNAVSALNSTVGVDDFMAGFEGVNIAGNVLSNDSDPEGELQTVLSQGSSSNPILIASGSYYLNTDGSFEFMPLPGFSGPVEIVYTVCDNNTTSFCTDATLHLLILSDIRVNIRVYLEGALMQNGGAKGSDNRPLMRDNLRNNTLTGQNYLPVSDPYTFNTAFVKIKSKYTHHGAGLLAKYQTIPDPETVFGVTGENAIVDWVFVELRSKSDYTKLLATRSGLVQRDGDVVDLDGVNSLAFPGISADSFYVVVRHRNHLGVMSQKIANSSLVDFTKPSTPVFNFGTSLNNGFNYSGLTQKSNLVQGYQSMWAGDFDGNRRIKFTNPNDDQNLLFFDVLAYPENSASSSNFNFGYGYLQGDYDMNGKSKYDNPNDDKNYLFSQILRYALNTELLSNFNFFIEQVPLSTSVE